ncbi:MAG: beta-galactosidase, partial [Bifidobacteriaceae bacterium]|nr:beta-galactosidase [Bifidobacteriaceae bacterium]
MRGEAVGPGGPGRRSVALRGHRLWVDGRAAPLLGGQVDYWLHPPPMWARILDSARACGLAMISCYVPWNYHLLADGSFDFSGRTDATRSLERFLDLAAEKDLWVFLRPGPWIYDFYMDGGVPLEASAHHRLDPRFLRAARRYLRALAPAVVPRLATNGGPIVLCQIDNEIEPLATQRGDSGGTRLAGDPVGDSYAAQIIDGPLEDPASFRSHLARAHRSARSFAASRGLPPADDWRQLRLGEAIEAPSPALRRDLAAYYRWYCAAYAEAVAQMLDDVGVDVPLALNLFANAQPQSAVDFAAVAPLVGGDYWGRNPLPWDSVLQVSRSARHLAAATGTPWAAEYPSASIAQFVIEGVEDVATPDNAFYWGLLGMIVGLKGWNWYAIAERSSLYFAPINNYGGRVPEYFEAFAAVHREFADLDWPSFEPLRDAAIWFDQTAVSDQMEFRLGRDVPFHAISELGQGPWMAAFDRLHRLDLDLAVYDPAAAHNAATAGRAVVVAPQPLMSRQDQAHLLGLAEQGANLLFLGEPPRADWAGEPTDVFAGISLAAPGQTGRVGAGRAARLGRDATDAELIEALAALGSPRTVAAGQPGVLTSAWRRGEERLIIALNTNAVRAPGPVRIDPAALGL